MKAIELTKSIIDEALDEVFTKLKAEYNNNADRISRIDPVGNIHRSEDIDDQDMNISVVFNEQELYFSKVFFEFDMYADPYPAYTLAGDKDISEEVKSIIGLSTWTLLDSLRKIYFNLRKFEECNHAN